MFAVIDSQDARFWGLIEQLGADIGWQSPLYSRSALDYYQQRPLDTGSEMENRSFVMLWDSQPVAAFIGVLVTRGDGKKDLLAFEAPCHAIEVFDKLTIKASKKFLREVDKILEEMSGNIRFRDFIVGGRVSYVAQYLLSKGGVAAPVFTKMIDLSSDEAYLKSQLRKSYGSLVNWGIRELEPSVIGAEDVTWEMMDKFRQLHIREAGRETRSEASWRRQYDMVKAGKAFLVVGKQDEQVITAGWFMCSDTTCYYGVSASRRDLFQKPLFHALMWVAILHAKKIGCDYFEVGEQLYLNHPKDPQPSKKELGISDFKAGFGGETKMYLEVSL